MSEQSIPHLILERAERAPAAPAHFRHLNGEWQPTTWAAYGSELRRAGKALIALGVQPGEAICLFGVNAPEWVVFDTAAMAIGAVPAGIYATSSPSEIAYITGHSEAQVLLVDSVERLERSEKARKERPDMRVVLTDDNAPPQDGVIRWQEFLALGEDEHDEEFARRLDSLEPDGLATLIYTSGTTGDPKAVMLSHDNLVYTSSNAARAVGVTERDRVLSYLPLSHIAEQMFTVHGPATAGYSVYFSRGLDFLADDLQGVHPTLFFGVPRVWEKFQAAIAEKSGKASAPQRAIFAWAQRTGRRWEAAHAKGRSPGAALRLQYGLAKRLVYAKLKAALGLDVTESFMTGAAPLKKDTQKFFAGLGMPLFDVYGLSESTGAATFNSKGAYRLGTAGRPFADLEVKLSDEGEVLISGRSVFKGYYKDPEATDEMLRDGWLHTGDLGEFNSDGYLRITGRAKDIIVTSGGKNIAPHPIESGIRSNELVGEVVLIGDHRNYLTALVSLDPDAVETYAGEHGISPPLHESQEIREHIQATVDETNDQFARVEQVKKFAILPEPLSMDAGELTPTLKVKRATVAEKHADLIEGMYSGEKEAAAAG